MTTEALDTSLPCSQQSMMAGEPIHGTATAEVHAWLLLEHRERWEPDIADVVLPAALRERVSAVSDRHRLRMQLIRRWNAEGPLQAFVVRTHPRPRLWRFRFEDYEELAEVDIDALLSGDDNAGTPDLPPSLYLVCTHGRRDQCCALRGVAFLKTLSELEHDGELWQCSHLGGHRFAATMVYLPHGVSYGRLVPEDAEDMVEAHRNGRLYALHRYRGQTRYTQPVQSAEAWLRDQENDVSLEGPSLRGVSDRDGRHVVEFGLGSKIHRVTVETRTSHLLRKTSCNADEPVTPPWHYVIRHEATMMGADAPAS